MVTMSRDGFCEDLFRSVRACTARKRSGPKVGKQALMTPEDTSITHQVHGFNNVPLQELETDIQEACPSAVSEGLHVAFFGS